MHSTHTLPRLAGLPTPGARRPLQPCPAFSRCGAAPIRSALRRRSAPPAAARGDRTGPSGAWFIRAPPAGPVEDGGEAVARTSPLPPPPPASSPPAAPRRSPTPTTPALLAGLALPAAASASAAFAGIPIPGLPPGGFDLNGPASIAQALGVLAAIVAVHEAGHFSCARYFGVRVSQFCLGFGPPLWSATGEDGVEYSLRAIPLGGYVAFPDDDPDADTDPDDPDLLKNRPLPQRAAVISAGVAANLVSAGLVLLAQATTVGVAELDLLPGVAVPRVLSGSPAEAAGVKAGDVIEAINGAPIPATPGAVAAAVGAIQRSAGVPVTLDLIRGDPTGRALGAAPALVDGPVTAGEGAAARPAAPPTRVRLEVTPTGGDPAAAAGASTSSNSAAGDGRIGVQLATHATVRRVVARDPATAVRLAAGEYGRLGAAVVNGLVGLVSNFAEAARVVAGPVAIVAAGAEVARADVGGLFQFAAIVNINLAVVNLLPLPALDGGYLALIVLEAARGGAKLPEGVEQAIMGAGLLLLLATGALLIVRDTLQLTGLGG